MVQEFESKPDALKQQCSLSDQAVTSHNQTLSVYNKLEAMGFGLKKMKLLGDTNKSDRANNIHSHEG
jgi:hypothetical protein